MSLQILPEELLDMIGRRLSQTRKEMFNSYDTKLSRTQRAINAKDERIKKVNDGSQNKSSREEDFTSDGLEALKPFQSVISEEKTQSS